MDHATMIAAVAALLAASAGLLPKSESGPPRPGPAAISTPATAFAARVGKQKLTPKSRFGSGGQIAVGRCGYLGWSCREIAARPIASWREVSMQRVIQSVLVTAILIGTPTTAGAESVMKQCGEQWRTAKAAGTTNGATWPRLPPQL